MSTRLLLDGEDLATLMGRVRAEMGPDAVVVRAERVRTGGVAGFFAKEHYELTVEIPDRPTRAVQRLSARRPTRATSLAGLLDAADAEEAWEAGSTGRPSPAPFVPGFAPRTEPAVALATGPAPGAAPAQPHVSTNADTFASLLASIDDMTDVAGGSPAIAEISGPRLARGAPGRSAEPAESAEPAAPAGFTVGFPGALGVPDVSPVPGGSDRQALLRLGVPAALLGVGPLEENLPLSDLLKKLVRPPALVREPGSIIAVVGEPVQALAVATQLAARVRQDPHDVVLAGQMGAVTGHPRRLLSASAAALHRGRLADGDQVSIVAIGVGPEAQDWSVAADLLGDLGPDQAWAVVDARRKASDLRAWLREVGRVREFDVAATASVHETQEPGTVLDLGLPIGWIDGLPATPVVWAAVLSERLETGARWD